MLRRDFLGYAAIAPLADGITAPKRKLSGLLLQVEEAVREEFPDVMDVQIKYDPANKKIPLMFVAFRT